MFLRRARTTLARAHAAHARSAAAATPAAASTVNRVVAATNGLHHHLHQHPSAFAGGAFRRHYMDDVSRVLYPGPEVFVGEQAPGFDAPALVDGDLGRVKLSDYAGSYVVLFFYPLDFTFVCPTEITAFNDRAGEFEALNTKVIAVSTDSEYSHLAWSSMDRANGGLGAMRIPIVADRTKEISAKYGVLLEDKGIALRGLFIIDDQGVVQQITVNNLPVGRSVDETLRLVRAFQYTAEHGEVCPAGWTPGAPTITATPEGSKEYFESANDSKVTPSSDFAAKMRPITSREDFEALIRSPNPVVVDFMANWCGKCRQIAPEVDKLIDEHPNVTFAKFDTAVADLAPLSKELGVEAMPTFKFYKNGAESRDQVVGYKPKLLREAVRGL